ncbi:hypothetical protein [Polaromonas sp.]|uniref:hypothetical protein n=1 Tax=Polaromonas sp. TaxID=1869339 RepID=UPI003264F284
MSQRALFAIAYTLACLGLFWWLYPQAPYSDLKVVEGIPFEFKSCGRHCDTGVQIGDVILACSVSPLASSYACGKWYVPDAPAKATYFRMRTMMSLVFGGPGTAVLLRLEQNGKVIPNYTRESFAVAYTLGSILVILVFATPCFLLMQLALFIKKVASKRGATGTRAK